MWSCLGSVASLQSPYQSLYGKPTFEAAYAGSVYCVAPSWSERAIVADPNAILYHHQPAGIHIVPPQKKPRFFERFLPSPPDHPASRSSPFPPVFSPFVKNFTFQIQVNFPQRGSARGGLIFRSDRSSHAYYHFFIENDQFAFSLNGPLPLIAEKSDALLADKPNVLAVVAQETTFYLYINLRLVAVVHDTSLLHEGLIGILAGPSQGTIEFSHAKVWAK
jgi:hypothetical protein